MVSHGKALAEFGFRQTLRLQSRTLDTANSMTWWMDGGRRGRRFAKFLRSTIALPKPANLGLGGSNPSGRASPAPLLAGGFAARNESPRSRAPLQPEMILSGEDFWVFSLEQM